MALPLTGRGHSQIHLYAAGTDTTGTFDKNIFYFNFSYDRVDTLDRVSFYEGLQCPGSLDAPGQSERFHLKKSVRPINLRKVYMTFM
jgi:hypothetical protein